MLFGQFFLDFGLLIFIAPALLLGLWAQYRVRSTFARASRVPVGMSGCAAAMRILERAGIGHLQIEQVPGHLSDHYDPRHKVLRLSPEVYHGRTAAAVGIAAHEAGHAIQDARSYAPLVIRNAAVPAAGIGSGIGLLLAGVGVIFTIPVLLLAGIVLFSTVVFFQLVNLPVEFDASARAKSELAEAGIVSQEELGYVRSVLTAAALTYVAATLQAVLTLVYYIMRFQASNRD
jgi:Zn-dependent membrane protease YugP